MNHKSESKSVTVHVGPGLTVASMAPFIYGLIVISKSKLGLTLTGLVYGLALLVWFPGIFVLLNLVILFFYISWKLNG